MFPETNIRHKPKTAYYKVKHYRSIISTVVATVTAFALSPVRYYDPRYATRAHGQVLIIPHAREADSGEYCCIATNGVGEPAKSCGALQLKMSTWLLW